MAGIKKDNRELSREEDYRDYEERDIQDGWPYADGAGATSNDPENRAYGDTTANFDRDTNKGFRVETVDADGGAERLKDGMLPETIGVEDADDIEERVHDALSNVDDVDMNSINIHVDGNAVVLEGSVDSPQLSRRLKAVALSVAGVRSVRNDIEIDGVDARIPDDD